MTGPLHHATSTQSTLHDHCTGVLYIMIQCVRAAQDYVATSSPCPPCVAAPYGGRIRLMPCNRNSQDIQGHADISISATSPYWCRTLNTSSQVLEMSASPMAHPAAATVSSMSKILCCIIADVVLTNHTWPAKVIPPYRGRILI